MSLAPIEHRLEQRFRRYSAITTQSDPRNLGKCIPSTPGQQVLAELLAKELQAMELQNVICDKYATVTAVKPGNVPGAPRIGFICHLDTFDCGLCPHVKAQKIRYTGGDVCLNKEKNIWMRLREHAVLNKYVGQDILFSDGTSVLGADDKAAIASVMEMVANLDSSKEKHGDIVICFVPDEEIGLVGAKHLDVKGRFNVDFAYTLDCCELGEMVYECFNAASATIKFTGVSAHPMSAKGVMVNPLLMAVDFISQFNREETPECTELREGYWWFAKMDANSTQARLEAMVREHDLAKYTARKTYMLDVAKKVQAKYPTGKVEIEIEDVYANIANSLKDDFTAIDLLLEAMRKASVKPNIIPMRGGTDGAALSVKGLLTPNFFTGAHNFHSCFEFLPIPSFVKAYEVCHNIVLLGADKRKRTPSLL
ncbi:peptidase T, putative, metallo-peptidase, ClanMH, family M20B [Leishmania donovani]|uniref:Peptidase T, putative, metallo-peptidase, ClanMH, family M20B n=1 Tax=Leishmania donovani TaxID=5661 RepID=A0A3Q8IAN8_LEIDO|nr:peptidase T, putative, metallo-peptidase, ClanMH, family M20B [Leishmania donovani]